ncbi:unnamed protein product, partial [Ectocarpus sp. 4 AP-2014]
GQAWGRSSPGRGGGGRRAAWRRVSRGGSRPEAWPTGGLEGGAGTGRGHRWRPSRSRRGRGWSRSSPSRGGGGRVAAWRRGSRGGPRPEAWPARGLR